jgi:hypothetical protein
MTIHIPVEEFEEDFKIPWKAGLIKGAHIDYATNAIHGWFENNDVIVFRFKGYGFINDNRENIYNISIGTAGVLIEIIKKN